MAGTMDTPCKCEAVGYCTVHSREMNDITFDLCRRKDGYYEAFQIDKLRGFDGKQHTRPLLDASDRPSVERNFGKGPGTELVLLLDRWFKRFGVRLHPSCACKDRALRMNEWGPDGCMENMRGIVHTLRQGHRHQRVKLPFIVPAVRALIRLAIYRSRSRKQ